MSESAMTEQEFQELVNALIKKENNLLLFKNDTTEIYILGTIHHYHFMKSSDYSLAHVKSVVDTLRPDIVLIETRSETLDKYDAVDGPFEMIYGRCLAVGQGIPVKGIDWWQVVKDNETMNTLNLERDNRMFENIVSAVASYGRVLVLCGAQHRARMPERFIKNGYIQHEIADVINYFNNISTPFKYPKGMADEYDRSVNYFQNGFIDEINRAISPGDELFDHFTKISTQNNRHETMDMIIENKLYK